MQTILDKDTRDAVIERIQKLSPDGRAQWGSMTVYQMLQHCILAEEMYLQKKTYKRALLGRVFGKIALKSLLKDDAPMPRNAKTRAAFLVKETGGDTEAARQNWIALINAYAHFRHNETTHWFFGKMTKEQAGILAYKHADHHLRQFGC